MCDYVVAGQFVALDVSVPVEETTVSGIVLPVDRPPQSVGVVLGIGPDVPSSFRKHVKVGDRVLYQSGLQYDLTEGHSLRPSKTFVYYFDVLARIDDYDPSLIACV